MPNPTDPTKVPTIPTQEEREALLKSLDKRVSIADADEQVIRQYIAALDHVEGERDAAIEYEKKLRTERDATHAAWLKLIQERDALRAELADKTEQLKRCNDQYQTMLNDAAALTEQLAWVLNHLEAAKGMALNRQRIIEEMKAQLAAMKKRDISQPTAGDGPRCHHGDMTYIPRVGVWARAECGCRAEKRFRFTTGDPKHAANLIALALTQTQAGDVSGELKAFDEKISTTADLPLPGLDVRTAVRDLMRRWDARGDEKNNLNFMHDCTQINAWCRILLFSIAPAILAATKLHDALERILAEPFGCPFCDSGKLRNPQKQHTETCGFGLARQLLSPQVPRDEGRTEDE